MIERSMHKPPNVSPQDMRDKISKRLGKRVASHTVEIGSGDEETLLDPINHGVRDARMASKGEDQSTSRIKKPSTARQSLEEIYVCPVHGCPKRCVNKLEFDNHMKVFHDKFEDERPSLLLSQKSLPVRSKPVERQHLLDSLNNDDDDKNAESTARPPTDVVILQRDPDRDDVQSEMAESITRFSQMSMSDIMPASSTHSVYTDSMALESDAALSDIAETESQEVQWPVQILITMWRRFVADYIRTHPNGAGKSNDVAHRPRGRQNSGRASASNLVKRSSSISSSTTSNKHGRDSDDEDESRKKKPKPSQLITPVETLPIKDRPLACPFNKFDNIQFGQVNKEYHVCATWNSVKTAYLKQHLQRSHCPPMHSCPRCQEDFKTATALLEHQRQDLACSKQELDKQKILPQHQEELGLRNRNAVGQDRESYWFTVFETLFPGERASRDQGEKKFDPYYRGPAHEVLERFLRFSELKIPRVLSHVRDQLKFESESTPERDAELSRMILQEASQLFMAEMSNAAPIDLRQLEQQPANVQDYDDAQAEATVRPYDGPRFAQSQPQPQIQPPTPVMTSEADFTQMGQSAQLNLQQPTIDPSTLYQHSFPLEPLPARPAGTNDHVHVPPQPTQPDAHPELFFGSFDDFESIIGPNFDGAIETNEMFPEDSEFPGYLNIARPNY